MAVTDMGMCVGNRACVWAIGHVWVINLCTLQGDKHTRARTHTVSGLLWMHDMHYAYLRIIMRIIMHIIMCVLFTIVYYYVYYVDYVHYVYVRRVSTTASSTKFES